MIKEKNCLEDKLNKLYNQIIESVKRREQFAFHGALAEYITLRNEYKTKFGEDYSPHETKEG